MDGAAIIGAPKGPGRAEDDLGVNEELNISRARRPSATIHQVGGQTALSQRAPYRRIGAPQAWHVWMAGGVQMDQFGALRAIDLVNRFQSVRVILRTGPVTR
jgi:hypothetical protein